MLILTSSDASARYKQDILRCLAAPIGSVIQFRYDRNLIAKGVMEKLLDSKIAVPAIVCSIASKGVGPLTLVPVRMVKIISAQSHGSTISFQLQIGEVAFCESGEFTQSADENSGNSSPRRAVEGDQINGSYVFDVERLPGFLKTETDLRLWELTVTELSQQHSYVDEPFFWTVVGLRESGNSFDTSHLQAWPTKISASGEFSINVYHFSPKAGGAPNSRLELILGQGAETIVPPDLRIDSRYDFKQWLCKSTWTGRADHISWMRLRTATGWDLDLRITLSGSLWRWFLRTCVAGILIALPAVIAINSQKLPTDEKISAFIMSGVFGILAALAANYHIERMD